MAKLVDFAVFAVLWVLAPVEVESNDENGQAVIIAALVLFVLAIIVLLPLMNQHGNINPGCAVIANTPACK
jgi:uncharacterized membrane protein YkvI